MGEEEARERWNLTEKGNDFSKGRRWPCIKGEGGEKCILKLARIPHLNSHKNSTNNINN